MSGERQNKPAPKKISTNKNYILKMERRFSQSEVGRANEIECATRRPIRHATSPLSTHAREKVYRSFARKLYARPDSSRRAHAIPNLNFVFEI